MLFLRSIQLTFEHPILGVGPGEFMDAEAEEAAVAGKKAMWHFTHNSYTELSSETGLPGLGLSLCRKIVARHGGDIEAVGTKGKGSEFRIRIPLKGGIGHLI